MHNLSKDTETFSSRRVEALTDGVFAIAMTLLILDLHADEIGRVGSSAELWHGLSNMSAGLVSFVISFLMLGSMWAVHARQFDYIKTVDRHLIALNTARLLAVVFMPLTTSISSAYSHVALGKMLLPLNFFILTFLSYLQWRYASSEKRNLCEPLSDENRAYFKFRNNSVLMLAAFTLVLSIWLGNLAFVIFAITGFLNKRLFLYLQKHHTRKPEHLQHSK